MEDNNNKENDGRIRKQNSEVKPEEIRSLFIFMLRRFERRKLAFKKKVFNVLNSTSNEQAKK